MDQLLRSWLKPPRLLTNNEQGVVIITALLVLVILTIVGIASINISNTEVRIAGHEVAYQRNFYRAEGAAMEAIQKLEAEPNLKSNPPAWVETIKDNLSDTTIQDSGFWQGSESIVPTTSTLEDSQFVAASNGIATGTSLAMSSSKVYHYTIYGRCAPPSNGGVTLVQLGYLIAY